MNYQYRAFFQKTELVATGNVEAKDASEARDSVYGRCGSWTDEETKYEFTAGCPNFVEVKENPIGEQQYIHMTTSCQDTKDGWIASYTDEELEERKLTAEQAFNEDLGVTLFPLQEEEEEEIKLQDEILKLVILYAKEVFYGKEKVISLIQEYFNCTEADVDDNGDIWIANPQTGHWIDQDTKKSFINWCQFGINI